MKDLKTSIKKDMEDAKSICSDVDGLLVEANDIIAKAKKRQLLLESKHTKKRKIVLMLNLQVLN